MGIHLDQVAYSSYHEAYKNYDTLTSTIAMSGTIASGANQTFSAAIPYARGGTRADIYLKGNSQKICANQSFRLATGGAYQFKSTEVATVSIEYSSSSITVSIDIFNGTGGSLTLTNQTLDVSVVVYDAPITAI